jgi:hypothetical protein
MLGSLWWWNDGVADEDDSDEDSKDDDKEDRKGAEPLDESNTLGIAENGDDADSIDATDDDDEAHGDDDDI